MKTPSATINREPHRIWKILSCLLAMLSFQAVSGASPKVFQAQAQRICNLLTDSAVPVEKAVVASGLPAEIKTTSITPADTVIAWHIAALHWQLPGHSVAGPASVFHFASQSICNDHITVNSAQTLSAGQLRLLAFVRRFSQTPPPASQII